MQFINNSPIYKIVRVTGPTHNILVLRLSSAAVTAPVRVEALDGSQDCPNPIGAHEVLENVVNAIRDWEIASGKIYFLESIQYIASDSRPADIYYKMAQEVLRRIEMRPTP